MTSIHYRPHTDPRSSHQQIARLVAEFGQQGYSPVLDVGCAQGILGEMLSGGDIAIDGIEPNDAWAKLARPHYRQVWASTIEDARLQPGLYRLVVCGDVLEHVLDPVAALQRLRAAAAPDARFIISLPNVAHIAVRLMLLAGRFPRMQRGILDKTHLHFFERHTARQVLRAAGLNVECMSVTGVPIDELWPRGQGTLLFRALVRFQHLLLTLMPGLFGYQLIFVASAGAAAEQGV